MKSAVERANGSKDSSAESTQPTQPTQPTQLERRIAVMQRVPPKQQVTGVPPKQQVTGDDAAERSVAERRIAAMRPKRHIGGAAKHVGEAEVTDRPKQAWVIIITPSRSS